MFFIYRSKIHHILFFYLPVKFRFFQYIKWESNYKFSYSGRYAAADGIWFERKLLTTSDPEYSGRPVIQTAFKFRRKIKFQYLSTETLSLRCNEIFKNLSTEAKTSKKSWKNLQLRWKFIFFIYDIKIYMQYNVVLALANFWRVQHITAHSSPYFPQNR